MTKPFQNTYSDSLSPYEASYRSTALRYIYPLFNMVCKYHYFLIEGIVTRYNGLHGKIEHVARVYNGLYDTIKAIVTINRPLLGNFKSLVTVDKIVFFSMRVPVTVHKAIYERKASLVTLCNAFFKQLIHPILQQFVTENHLHTS